MSIIWLYSNDQYEISLSYDLMTDECLPLTGFPSLALKKHYLVPSCNLAVLTSSLSLQLKKIEFYSADGVITKEFRCTTM